MKTKARPRVRIQQRARRAFVYVFFVAVLGGTAWLLEVRFGVFAFLGEMVGPITAFQSQANVPRGTIYDRNLKQVALSLDRVLVYARTKELKSIPDTVKVLGEILSFDEKELQQKLESGDLRVWLAEDISHEQEIAIKSKRLSGIYLQKEEKRFYPNGTQAAHVIGYAEDGIGLAGVELYYDRLLAGRKRQKEGQMHFSSSQDLVLTLDLKIQDILDKIIEDIAVQGAVRQAMVYVMEGHTGEVIGGSQTPTFDPNSFTRYSTDVLASRFVMPVLLPHKFRAFLRDVAVLYGREDQEYVNLPWSVRSSDGGLGDQLRLWDWLGFNDRPLTDFHLSMQPGEVLQSAQQPALPRRPFLEMVPEHATPFTILSAVSTILNGGRLVKPFAVKSNAGDEVALLSLSGEKAAAEGGIKNTSLNFLDAAELFHSQARQGVARSSFFRDEISVLVPKGTDRTLLVSEFLLATIPAGGNNLNLLVMVEREGEGPNTKNGGKTMTLEQIVEEKVERISILQQVAKTVADVVEPELSADGNYQGTKSRQEEPAVTGKQMDESPKAIIMPDLRGQSLRKSLRLLQGVYLKISIRGTGVVVSQKPAPGVSLKGISECELILDLAENRIPDKSVKRMAEKNGKTKAPGH